MKLKIVLLALFAAGIAVSLAVAAPPPGKGYNKLAATTSSSTGTATTTTSTGGKVALCHKTGSRSHAWVRITVAKAAVAAHLRHGDTTAGDGGCSTLSTTGAVTTTAPTTTT